MSQKLYLNLLKIGIYASLLVVFLVFKSLLFPYITSKQISFNLIIEALFVFWVAFIVKYPEYRPKFSYITYGIAAFLAALVLSSIFGVDFNLSFWGDVERMLGVFHVLHFFAFYLIIISVFREWKDWKLFFIISIIFSIIVSLYSYSEAGAQISTIGNPSYVSAYMIFNMFFAMILFFREKNLVLKWTYVASIIPLYLGFQMGGTSGAYVGLAVSLAVIFLFYVIFSKNKKIKISALLAGLIIFGVIGLFVANKDKAWAKNNPLLVQIQDINWQKDTFQTRLISWKAAAKDFKDHPILGSGFGNYAVIFDKYFTPNFYDFTRGETYFDRAHNNVVDIGSTSGLLGLVTYLSIFGAVAFYLIRGFRNGKINLHEFVLLTGLMVAYFIQNLAVFDSLVTYMALMMALAYIYWLDRTDEGRAFTKDRPLENPEIYALAGVGILAFIIMYQFNIKPFEMLVSTINGQRAWAAGQVKETVDIYREALSLNTVLDRDSRTSLNRLFANNPDVLSGLDQKTARDILDYNIELADANVKYNASDSLNQMLLAQVLNTAASYNRGDPEKFEYYSGRALEAIDKSIAASPGRVPIYFQKAQIYITRGEQDKAIETLKYAYNLYPPYYDSACYLGRTLLFYKQETEGFEYIDKCLELGGVKLISPDSYVKSLINHYVEKADWPKVIKLYERLLELDPKNVDNWIKAAKLYAENGMKDKARAAAEKAIELNPSYQQYADEFIDSLK